MHFCLISIITYHEDVLSSFFYFYKRWSCLFHLETITQNQNGWEGASGVHFIHFISSQTGPSRAVCWGPCPDSFLVSDSKDGDSTASLDSLWQDIIVLTVKKSVLIFKVILLCFSVCPLPLVLQPEVVQFRLLYTFPSHNHKIPLLPLISSPGWSFCYWKDDPVP